MQRTFPIPTIFRLGLLGVTLLFLTSCGGGKRTKLEHARVQSILINCRAYATDNEGRYPSGLSDLYPKYIDLVSNFYSPPHSAVEDKPQAYYYRPGLQVGAKVDEPLVVSPHVIKGKVNVGYLGGFIRKLDKEEVQKMLGSPAWIQNAPPLRK